MVDDRMDLLPQFGILLMEFVFALSKAPQTRSLLRTCLEELEHFGIVEDVAFGFAEFSAQLSIGCFQLCFCFFQPFHRFLFLRSHFFLDQLLEQLLSQFAVGGDSGKGDFVFPQNMVDVFQVVVCVHFQSSGDDPVSSAFLLHDALVFDLAEDLFPGFDRLFQHALALLLSRVALQSLLHLD